MTVQLSEELHWIEECYDLGGEHKHVSVYLLRDDDASVLVDSGAFHDRDAIVERVAEATGGEPVDALVLSHSDYPHAANVREFVGPGSELVASPGAPAKQGLPEATKCEIGSKMTVAGRTFSFVDPPLADRSHTTWIYDHGAETLFTADGFGSRHPPGDCRLTSREFDDGVPAEAIEDYHRNELVWLRYVDPEQLRAALESILGRFDVSWVAPIHGHPIAGEDLDRYLDRLIDAAERIAGEYEVPS